MTYGRLLILFALTLWSSTLLSQEADTLVIEPELTDSATKAMEKRIMAGTDSLFKTWNEAVDTTRRDSITVRAVTKKDEHFTPDPTRAVWLGLVFPGGGQIYNRKFWKLPIFYGGFLGCMYALTWNNTMLRDYSQAYLDIMDDDPTTASYMKMLPMGYSIEGKESRFKEIFKNKKNYFRKYRDLSIFAFFGVYALSVIDAYVDAELSTFDISRDLSIHWEPAVIDTALPTPHHRAQNSYGLQCSINF